MRKVILVIIALGLLLQTIVWPLPLYYWLAGESTRAVLALGGQQLLEIKARGPWKSPQVKKWEILSSRAVLERKIPFSKDVYTIVAFTPWDLNRLNYSQRVTYIQKATKQAVALGVNLVCDASAADRARMTEPQQESTKLLKKAKVARAVLFDGGHHLPNLALRPELLLCPIINHQGDTLIAHGFCQDAVPFAKLLSLQEKLGLNAAIITFPRFTGYLKSPRAMGALLIEALRLLETTPAERKQVELSLLSSGPCYAFFQGGILLWRPLGEELANFEKVFLGFEEKLGAKIQEAYLSIEGKAPLPASCPWQLVSVGLSSMEIMLAKLGF